ncbi:PIR Superfamily Protein, partial [Plasmodium ovale curtisi]
MSDDKYSFFSNFSYYERKEDNILRVEVNEKSCCDSFLKDSIFIHIPFPDKFCEQFKKLHNLLLNSMVNNKKSDTLENSDCAFLNYWLNNKLRGVNIDTSISVNEFYNKIKAKNADIFKNISLKKKLYNIEKHELEKMRTLYDLYNIKSQIDTALSEDSPIEKRVTCS